MFHWSCLNRLEIVIVHYEYWVQVFLGILGRHEAVVAADCDAKCLAGAAGGGMSCADASACDAVRAPASVWEMGCHVLISFPPVWHSRPLENPWRSGFLSLLILLNLVNFLCAAPESPPQLPSSPDLTYENFLQTCPRWDVLVLQDVSAQSLSLPDTRRSYAIFAPLTIILRT